MSKTQSIGVVIPTFRAAKHLPHCLPKLIESPLKPRVLVIDSSSDDETVTIAQKLGAEVLIIPQSQFNHGSTRELGRLYLGNTIDVAVMITQDAYPELNTLENLVSPILEGRASVSYARQLPHHQAGHLEAFPRLFNYPEKSHIRGIEDIKQYGIYTFFCSNSCAAYSNTALNEISGFQNVLLGEDTIALTTLLERGHKVAYVAEAIVRHSHHYNLWQEFQRHFDTGLVRNGFSALDLRKQRVNCSDEKRGLEYVKALTQYLIEKEPKLLPYAYLHVLAKWLGYNAGKMSQKAPQWLKKRLSSQSYYW